MRSLLAIALLVVLLLALVLSDHRDETVVRAQSTSEPTPTTAYPQEPMPDLGPRFGEYLAGVQRARAAHRAKSKRVYGGVSPSGHPCGPAFDLPPCSVMMRESGGNIHAYNPTGCGGRGCRGKWQCDPRTCSGTGSEEEQDAEARALWDHGRGCSHWAAC